MKKGWSFMPQQTQVRGQDVRDSRGRQDRPREQATVPRERPVHVVRFGSIKGAVWRNMTDMGNASRPMYNVTFSRSFKDGEQWRDSSSFGLDDLLTVSKVANECHSWIHAERSREVQEPL